MSWQVKMKKKKVVVQSIVFKLLLALPGWFLLCRQRILTLHDEVVASRLFSYVPLLALSHQVVFPDVMCVLHITPFFLPVDIQHTPCPS